MVTKRFKKSAKNISKKQEKDSVVHLSGDEDDDVSKFVERTEYKDRIPEDLELDLMESRTTAENLSKNVMIFADYDTGDSDEEDGKSKSNLHSKGSGKGSRVKKLDSENVMDTSESFTGMDDIDPTVRKYVEYMTFMENLKPVFEHFLEKLSETSRLHKLMSYYNILRNHMSCLITFHLFKFNDGRVFDMKKEEEKQIDLVMRFMDVLCDNYPEVEQIISLLGNETENEDILKDMYKNLNTVDCEEVYAELKDSSNISEEDGDELDYSEDDQLSSDSEDDLEDRELLRELKKKKDVGDDEDVKEKHVQRRLDQAILDNKGYVPGGKKKKKTPGVKRRQQFQKASLRNRSNVPGVRKEIPKHEGEARGIKTNVIKSRKF